MRLRILGFEWDTTNVAKVETHDLDPDDVESLFDRGEPDVFDHPTDASRFIALGFVPDDRFVLVVFEYNEETCWVRVVTAYEPTSNRWWKIYAKAKGIED
jgi:uncharacterized DUF497 family protein